MNSFLLLKISKLEARLKALEEKGGKQAEDTTLTDGSEY